MNILNDVLPGIAEQLQANQQAEDKKRAQRKEAAWFMVKAQIHDQIFVKKQTYATVRTDGLTRTEWTELAEKIRSTPSLQAELHLFDDGDGNYMIIKQSTLARQISQQ